jgi:transcriptional regulator with XRE-family HTH domain
MEVAEVEDFRRLRQEFGGQIRRLRAESRMSQEALANAAGLHRTYVGSLERGERNVSLENIAKLALALNVRIADLFVGLRA